MLDPYIRDIQGIRLRNEYVKRYYCGRRYLFQFYLSAKGYYTYDKTHNFSHVSINLQGEFSAKVPKKGQKLS